MITFNLPSMALLGRIVLLTLTVCFYLLFTLMTARFSRNALKFLIQVFLPVFAVILSILFGFISAIILWIVYVILSLPVREEELELKVIGMAFFLLSLIPISILMKMLIAF